MLRNALLLLHFSHNVGPRTETQDKFLKGAPERQATDVGRRIGPKLQPDCSISPECRFIMSLPEANKPDQAVGPSDLFDEANR